MARTQIRSKLGVVATTLGLAVLLAGPNTTLGLGVPTVDSATTQVTSTVQGAVQTTQQTAATTVQQVESTVQTTVQTTQQVAAPQPAAPAPAATAPAQTVTRVSAPAKKQATAVTRVSAPAKRVTTTVVATQRVASTTGFAPARVTGRATTRKVRRTQRVASAPARSSASEDPAPPCDVPLLALLPGGDQIRGLVAVACEAAGGLDLTARLGLTPQIDTTTPGPVDTGTPASSSKPSAFSRARAIAAGAHPGTGAGAPDAANAAANGQPGRAIAPLGSPVVGRGAGIAQIGATNAARVSPASGDSSRADGGASRHHSWFSGQSRGTEILLAIIFASLATLGGIALWRLAVRWVIPRFA